MKYLHLRRPWKLITGGEGGYVVLDCFCYKWLKAWSVKLLWGFVVKLRAIFWNLVKQWKYCRELRQVKWKLIKSYFRESIFFKFTTKFKIKILSLPSGYCNYSFLYIFFCFSVSELGQLMYIARYKKAWTFIGSLRCIKRPICQRPNCPKLIFLEPNCLDQFVRVSFFQKPIVLGPICPEYIYLGPRCPRLNCTGPIYPRSICPRIL